MPRDADVVLVRQAEFDQQYALVSEHWTAIRRFRGHHLEALFECGCPYGFWLNCGKPGVDDAGNYVLPCYDRVLAGTLVADPELHFHHLLDLLTFSLDRPDRWNLARGKAVVLGAVALDLAAEFGTPLAVNSTPLAWLKAGGEGICPLDLAGAAAWLSGYDSYVVDDPGLGKRLRATLEPQIFVRRAA